MATRRERVVLELEDRFTADMARAAAATTLLDKALGDLSGSAVRSRKDLDGPAEGADKVAKSSNKAGPEIDRLSGRLRLLTDVAVTLGPALVPLGAATIPVLTASLAGLGAAAGGIGVAVLAMKGLGDGIKAIDAYRVEPTVENLAKLREEADKLGPAGMEFARYLSNLEPVLRDLQNTARAGMFPGLEDGIDAVLTRGPQVQRIIGTIADELGDLARESGSALAGDDWDAFFTYIETDARPTLDSFAHSLGNIALGVANMLVAFAPVSRDFTSGLEDATRAFADWSKGLDQNQGFQDFVDYVRESGPMVVDLLSELIQALAGLVQAAAPMGQTLIPVLTGIAKVFATIASSPIGPGLYTGAAAMLAFSRASSIAEKSSAKFSSAWSKMGKRDLVQGGIAGLGLLAASASDADDKLGLANTTMDSMAGLLVGGPWGLAIGAAVGQVQDFSQASGDLTDQLNAASDAMRSNDADQMRTQLAGLQAEYDKLFNGDAKISDFGSQMDAVKGSFFEWTGQAEDLRGRISELEGALQEGGGAADLFGETIGQTGNQLSIAAGSADDFSGALARLNGWFDKRAAVRAYKDSIDELTKGLKNGFSREDAANIDAVGTSILQVAEGIKNPGARADFLTTARQQLVDMATTAGPQAARAIQEVIDKFDDKGLTHPPATELTVDDSRAKAKLAGVKNDTRILGKSVVKPTIDGNDSPFKQMYGTVKGAMAQADRLRASPTITANTGAAVAAINSVRHLLTGLNGTTATTYVRSVRVAERGGHAAGGYITGPGGPTEDAIPSWLSNGEYVMRAAAVKKYGRHAFDRLNAMHYASGGLVARGDSDSSDTGDDDKKHDGVTPARHAELAAAAKAAAAALKALEKQSRHLEAADARLEKARDKAQDKADAAQSRYDDIATTVSGTMLSDIFATSTASANPWAAGARAGGVMDPIGALQGDIGNEQQYNDLFNQLRGRGLSQGALEATARQGLDALKTVAGYNSDQLSQFGSLYDQRNQLAATASGNVASTLAGDQLAMANRNLEGAQDELREGNRRLRKIEQAVKQAEKANDRAQDKASEKVKDATTKPAKDARRRSRRT